MIRNESYFKNRINLMQGRDKDNANIIRKCNRQIKKLNKKDI